MTDVTHLFQSAELALGSYASLATGDTNDPDNIATLTGGSDTGAAEMTLAQTAAFALRYPTVVAQVNDDPTGFSVTVFKDGANNLTLAFRGMEFGILNDLTAAADIGTAGAAYAQIVAMANWWLRASAPEGQMVQQFRLTSYPADGVPPDALVIRPNGASVFVLEAAPSAAAFTVVSGHNLSAALAADPDGKVDVTGHSLGGHLAMAFSSLFAASTDHTTVFNAVGFIDNTNNQAFFGKLGGSIPTSGLIINVAADEALVDANPFNWIAGRNSRPGQQVNVGIEKQTNSDELAPIFPALNHSMGATSMTLGEMK